MELRTLSSTDMNPCSEGNIRDRTKAHPFTRSPPGLESRRLLHSLSDASWVMVSDPKSGRERERERQRERVKEREREREREMEREGDGEKEKEGERERWRKGDGEKESGKKWYR